MEHPLILDTDPGIDDAAAIALLASQNKYTIKLITTVAGNVSIDNTTDNALKLKHLLNIDAPIAQGAHEPILCSPQENASNVHGESGMDGYDFPQHGLKPLRTHAVVAMRDLIMDSPVPYTLCGIGPLTNFCLLLKTFPEVRSNIKEIVIMGGALTTGNTNTLAEFNIRTDPIAAKAVFHSGIPLRAFGLDVTREAVIHRPGLEKIRESGRVGEVFYSLFSHYRGGSFEKGLRIHDATAIAWLMEPDFFTFENKYIDVVVEGVAAGALVTDFFSSDYSDCEPNVMWATNIDSEAFEDWFINKFIEMETAHEN